MQRHRHVDGPLELTRLTTADAELEFVILTAVGEDLNRLVVRIRHHNAPVT